MSTLPNSSVLSRICFFGAVSAAILAGALALVLEATMVSQPKTSLFPHGLREFHRFLWSNPRFDHGGKFLAAFSLASTYLGDSDSLNGYLASGPPPLARWNHVPLKHAADDFAAIIRSAPDDDLAWNNLAWLYAVSGDTQRAADAERRAISLYSFDYTYYVLLGTFLERSGNVSEAESCYKQALLLYPRLQQSSFWATLHENNPTLSASALSDVRSVSQSDTVQDDIRIEENYGRFYWNNGMISEAQNIARHTSLLLPAVSGTWELEGEIEQRDRHDDKADLDFQRAVFLDEDDPLPHDMLSQLALNAGDPASSRDELQRALKQVRTLESPASSRHNMEYRHSRMPNEQLPKQLMQETTPYFDFASQFTRLAVLFTHRGYPAQADKMRNIAAQFSSAGYVDDEYGSQ